MSRGGDSRKRFAFPGATFGELPDEIHVVPKAKWQHPLYGEIKITSANVSEFVQMQSNRA